MKIKKTPVKKLAVPPLPIRNLIQALKECPESEIATHIDATPEWIWPRGDLFHWVGVLNRFDDILDSLCKSHEMKTRPKPFSPENQRLVYAILSFSRLLLESCTNRNLYASYEQLNDLLHSRDLDILEACLRLLLRPAQRHSAQRSARSIFTVSQERLLAIAHSWGSKDYGLDLVQLAEGSTDIPERLSTLNFQFYRTISLPKLSDAPSPTPSTSVSSTSAPVASSSTITSPSKRRPSRSGPSSAPGANTESSSATEGMVVIHASDPSLLGQSDDEILSRLIQDYQIPEEHQFQLLCRIRIATGIRNPDRRRQLLTIRILAIAVMSHVLPEAVVLDKFFAFEPEIIQSLTDVIHPDHNMPFSLQTVALFALDGLAHLRGKQPDVLTAINASASHGVLLYALRKIVSGLDTDNVLYPQEFLDAMFAFLSFIISFQTGGNMVISAGLVPILLQLLTNKRVNQLKNITKTITVLDSLIYGFSTAFTSFCASNGINLLVARMKEEVDYSLTIVKEAEAQKMTEITEASKDGVKEEEMSPVPFERTALLKAMFKFVHHMMQSPGTQEGLRNLIDTSLPATLKVIMENPSALGTSVYAHAINTMTSFIHNEPTSLAILQEANIPQTLLSSLSKEIPASTDVVTSIPGAFGAICLNAPGLEMMTKEFPMKKLFDIFTSIPHVRAFQESDINSNIGVSMDELVRHQPTLKSSVMKEISTMLNAVLQKCAPEEILADEMVFCTLQKTRAADAPVPSESNEEDESKDDRKDSLVAQLIEGAARFCESFFQNSSNARDFLKDNGVDLLMKFYRLPTLPYDLANTPAFFTLSHLLKLLSETNPAVAVAAVVNEVNQRLDAVKPLLESQNAGSQLIKYIDISSLSESDVAQGNAILSSLISLHALSGLLSDMYCAPAFSHGRNSASVLSAFVTAQGDKALSGLGQLHRMCLWESIVMKRIFQKGWNDPNPKAKKLLNNPLIPGTVDDNIDEASTGDKDMSTQVPEIDMYSPTAVNTKYFKFVLTQIPHYLTPMYQGITKMLIIRREVEAGHRTNAFKIADSLCRVIQSHVSWTRIDASESEVDKTTYLSSMLQLIPYLILDGRSPRTLQTIVVISFVRTDGLNTLFALLDSIWTKAKHLQSLTTPPENNQKDIIAKMLSAEEIVLNVFQTITSSTLLLDSSHTATLNNSRDEKSREVDYFEPHGFMVDARVAILPQVRVLWEDDYLKQCPTSLIQQVIQILINIFRAEGEYRHLTPTVAAPVVTGATPSLFGARPIVPDATSVATLLDMGFPRAAAELALTRCGNQIDRAAEYLLTHQEVVQAAFYDQEREEAAARSAAAAPTTTPAEASNPATEEPTAEEAAAEGSSTAPEQPQASDAEDTTDDSEVDENEDEDEDEDEDEADMLQQALAMSVSEGNGVASSEDSSSAPVMATSEAPAQDAGASSSSSASSSSATDKQDANKIALEKYKTQKEELSKLRDEMRPLLVPRALELMQSVDEIVFFVRDLIVFLSRDKESKIIDQLVEDIQQFASMDETETEERKKVFGTRLRLLALLFADTVIQNKMESYASVLVPMLMSILVKSVVPQKENPWLSPLLLMIEGFVSLSDEPKVVPDETTAEGKAKAEQQDKEMKEDIVSPADMEALLMYCFALLKQTELVKDVVLSVFRILVRLTRHHHLAIEFLKADGLPLIFSTLKPERLGVRGQQSMVVMIMRHIIEDTQVLQAAMEKEIYRWMAQPTRNRSIDVPVYLRHNTFLGMRNHEAFISGTLNVCKVAKHDANFKTLQIALAKSDVPQKVEEKKDGEPSTESKDKDKEAEAPAESSSASVPSLSATTLTDATKKYSSQISEALIHFLVSELLVCRSNASLAGVTATPATPATPATLATHAITVASTSTDEPRAPSASDVPSTTEKTADAAFDANFVQRCFLLQCLHELLISYPTCKVDLMNYSRRKGSKESLNIASKPKANWLAFLLSDVIPYRGTVAQSSNTEFRKHSIESNFASSVLVAMCSNSDDEEEKKPFSELVQVRRFVVDGIIRSFKDAITSTDPVEIKYGKFLSLSELSFKILSASGTAGSTAKPNEDMSINIVKVMLEKNFITTLTNVLADIDLNYPHAKVLANAVLKPLEHLTKLSLKMSRALEPGAAKPRRRSTPLSATGSGNGSGDDAPDLYRNSSLGMFDGANMESEEEHESDDSMGEEDIFDEDEYDEETASDASDLSDEGLSDEDEDEEAAEETIPRNPFLRHETSDDENDDEHMDDDEDDDEDMEAELQEALERDQEDEEMEGAMDWDQGTHRPVMLDDDEIGEVIGDDDDDHSEHEDFFEDQEHHHHHHQHHDDEGTGEDDEEVDEDEEGDEDDDHDDDDEEEEDDIDNMGLEEAGEFFQIGRQGRHHHHHHGPMTHTFVINDSDILRNGALGLDLRGRRPRLAGRRLDERGFIWNEADSEQGRFASLEDDQFTALDAPARNPYIQGSDDVTTHPLLAPPPAAAAGATDNRPRTGSRNLGLTDWHTFEELLNENTSQCLPCRSHRHQPDGSVTSSKDDMFSIVQEFVPYSTAQRWSQEGRMMYGLAVQDKAARLVTHVVNALIPAAKEEQRLKNERDAKEQELRRKVEADRKRIADEKRKAEEEAERIKAEEAEKARREEEAAAAEREAARLAERAARGETVEPVEDTAMEVEAAAGPSSTATAPEPAPPAEPARRTVMIDGEMVDITDSDIDPEFLEALPEDMRREVYNDYLQSHRPPAPPAQAAASAASSSNAINSDFLDALPQNMRTELDELLRGQRTASGARESLPGLNAYANLTSTLSDYAATLSRLMPQLRQFGNPPASLEDAALLNQIPRHFPGLRGARDILAGGPGSSTGPSTKKTPVQRDAIQLVDKSSLATLVRLMFLPQQLSKNILNKLLVNLCENSKTRSELLSLLLSILQDGGADLAAVDKSFAQMSLRGKPFSKSSNKVKGSGSSPPTVTAASDHVPNLVARRCLESLHYIVAYNAHAAVFFLSEHENVTLKKPLKKGKGKDKVMSSKYPIVLLLDLLERPIFVQHSALMEQLMNLLSVICRPLATLSTSATDDKDKETIAEPTVAQDAVPTEASSTTAASTSSTVTPAPASTPTPAPAPA
ncbi:hypothetical protein BGZ82_005652, partial [Podila clonocystis]